MINQSKIPESIQKKIWAEAAHHSTDVINCICTPNNKIPPYKAFYGENPTYFKHLRPFGQLAVTLDVHTKLKGKTKNRGLLGLYVGRAVDHSPETCRLFKLDTQRIIITRDVRFTNQMYADYFADTEITGNRFTILQDDDNDDDEINHLTDRYPPQSPVLQDIPTPVLPEDPDETEMPGLIPDDEEDSRIPPITTNHELNTMTYPTEIPNVTMTTHRTPPPRLTSELRKLAGFTNPIATQAYQALKSGSTPQYNTPTTRVTRSTTTNADTSTRQIPVVETPSTNPTTDNTNTSDSHPPPSPTSDIEDISDEISTIASPTTEIMDRALVMVESNPLWYLYNHSLPKTPPSNPYNVLDNQLKDVLTVPDKYEDAYFHPDAWCRDRWRTAIRHELDKMAQLKVWYTVGRQELPA
jgi:hypothetical protein